MAKYLCFFRIGHRLDWCNESLKVINVAEYLFIVRLGAGRDFNHPLARAIFELVNSMGVEWIMWHTCNVWTQSSKKSQFSFFIAFNNINSINQTIIIIILNYHRENHEWSWKKIIAIQLLKNCKKKIGKSSINEFKFIQKHIPKNVNSSIDIFD